MSEQTNELNLTKTRVMLTLKFKCLRVANTNKPLISIIKTSALTLI
jgi:hypothetical protein